jgi:sulfatase modifying factor 1
MERSAAAAIDETAAGPTGMVLVPGGTFAMGADGFYPEERPVHRTSVDAFWMDRAPVTVAEFRRFVKASGYVTVAERPLDPTDYPDADPDVLVPGSLVFQPTRGPVDMRDVSNWWHYVPGARWDRPEGPGTDTYSRARHPVVHVACEDAEAYAAWAGKALPTEAEWERAARGGLDGAVYAWGDDPAPDGRAMANFWQGEFPWQNLLHDGFAGTSPTGSFEPNGFGLEDMTGNVWEWTADYFTPRHAEDAAKACCAPHNPRVTSAAQSRVAGEPGAHIPRRVIKGGSHLCAANYCLRYRPAARQGETVDTSTSHIGFRCVVRAA